MTPPGEVRRYDTRFFVAALPDGADAQDVTSESSSAGWFGVGAALERAQRGELGMLPPTIMTLAVARRVRDGGRGARRAAGTALAASRCAPHIERDGDGGYLAKLPDGTRVRDAAARCSR